MFHEFAERTSHDNRLMFGMSIAEVAGMMLAQVACLSTAFLSSEASIRTVAAIAIVINASTMVRRLEFTTMHALENIEAGIVITLVFPCAFFALAVRFIVTGSLA